MSVMIEVVKADTKKIVRTLGPMTAHKAERVERGLLRKLNDGYYIQTVRVINDPEDNTDNEITQPMENPNGS